MRKNNRDAPATSLAIALKRVAWGRWIVLAKKELPC